MNKKFLSLFAIPFIAFVFLAKCASITNNFNLWKPKKIDNLTPISLDKNGNFTNDFIVMTNVVKKKKDDVQLSNKDNLTLPFPQNIIFQEPYTWSLTKTNSLPNGLTLSSSGLLSGICIDRPGYYEFVAKVIDKKHHIFFKKYRLMVRPGGFWFLFH